MSFLFPLLTFLLSYLLGKSLITHLSIKIFEPTKIFFSISLGIIFFSILTYFLSLVLGFPKSIYIGQFLIFIFLILDQWKFRTFSNFWIDFRDFFKCIPLISLILILSPLLYVMFDTHIIPNIGGDLYTGESTYGDLPFHLSIISEMAIGGHFPPQNPMFQGLQLVYPFLINFFSAILVIEGMSLRDSIIIPGLILSISIAAIIFELGFFLTKKVSIGFLTALLYFFNGGLGFYFFLSDYSFNLLQISNALLTPEKIKEYSHLFEQNIQWGNFLTRMIVPERSLLLGIPAGIILLRILFFHEPREKTNWFNIFVAAILASSMALLHTHTVLAMAVIVPTTFILTLDKNYWKKQFLDFGIFVLLTILFVIPNSFIFLNHVGESNFMKFHFGWLTKENESIIWFWFKNAYLLIPFSFLAFFLPRIPKPIKILQVCAFILFVLVNTVSFSPYTWDNVKFLFWIGLFWDLALASLIVIYFKRNIMLKIFSVILIFTMIATSLLSIIREVNVKYVLFTREDIAISEAIQKNTKSNDIFLTFPIHNSPVNNLAGRQILMGYPGLLWTQGINYNSRESDINQIFSGSQNTDELLKKYKVNYVVLRNFSPENKYLNQEFFKKYPLYISSDSYKIYKMQ